ncbi:hypothetical protein [Henriciella aquimarina]|uniref:hypothetical protein n=1 Tax=Henriciella aquimarina TaxID=545261 RepID=UPI001301F0DB|nr:hypothetical protein [Henriciella aquimarina]
MRRLAIACVEVTALPVPFNAITLYIVKVRPEGTKPTPLTGPRNMEFDDDPPHPERRQSPALKFKLPGRCRSPSNLTAGIARSSGLSTKPGGCFPKLLRETLAATLPAIPDPAKPWREFVID